MKILLVSQYYYPERFTVTDIAEGLVKLGNEVTVLTGKPNYGYDKIPTEYKKVSYEEINGVKVHRVKTVNRHYNHLSISLNYLSYWWNAKAKVNKLGKDFDIVLTISLSPVISIAPAIKYAKKYNVPFVLYCLDLWPESTLIAGAVKKNSLVYKLLYKWSKSLYSNCDHIIVSSPSFISYFKDVLKLENKDYSVINQPTLTSKKTLEKVVYSNKNNLVYAGNLTNIQLINNIVKAMKYLENDDVVLHLMGMGNQLKNIQQYIKENNIKNIVYEGALPIEKAETFFYNADALIVSLKDEGYVGKTIPNKAIQYLKYGRPVLGIIKGDAKELLEKTNGCVFSESDEKSIAESIRKIIKMDDNTKNNLGKNNQDYYENNLTNEKLIYLFDKSLKSFKK